MATAIRFDDLEDLDAFKSAPTTTPSKYTERVQYPCMACAGSGLYRSVRIHQDKTHCFACKGKGYFFTSPQQRQKAKAGAAARKMQKQADELQRKQEVAQAWHAANPELSAYLESSSSWNGFSKAMIEAVVRFGSLTVGQAAAVARGMAEQNQREAEKVTEAANKVVIDLARIFEMFQTAKAAGLQKPALIVGSLRISMAPAHGKNAGSLYVKDRGDYAGKITSEGKYFGIRESRKEIEAELIEIAKDPRGKTTEHGRLTGRCSCCGRELTDKASVALGIGPVCAEKWGF